MIDGVEPFAHVNALLDLHIDLLLTKRLQHHEGNRGVEASGVNPAREKSLTHDGSEVALLDVERVGHGE